MELTRRDAIKNALVMLLWDLLFLPKEQVMIFAERADIKELEICLVTVHDIYTQHQSLSGNERQEFEEQIQKFMEWLLSIYHNASTELIRTVERNEEEIDHPLENLFI